MAKARLVAVISASPRSGYLLLLACAGLLACGGGSSSGGGGATADETGGGERAAGPHGLHAGAHGSCFHPGRGICNEELEVMNDERRAAARETCETSEGRWSDGVCPGTDAIAWCGDSTNAWFYAPTAALETARTACPSHAHFYDLASPEAQTAIAPPLHERADGSCTTTTPARCHEYIVDPAALASTGEACTAGGGTWALTPCATDGAIGHCGLAWFYGTMEDAQAMCGHGDEPFVATAR
jgi:hypothetical protein